MNQNSLQYIASLVEVLKSKDENFKPLNQKKIDSLQKKYNIVLPKAYVEFLSVMGKGANRFMIGSSIFYPELFELQEWGKELVEENNISELLKNAFIFWMHQGYQMAYFLLNGLSNPSVYYFSERNKEWEEIPSFTKFLEIQLIFSGLS